MIGLALLGIGALLLWAALTKRGDAVLSALQINLPANAGGSTQPNEPVGGNATFNAALIPGFDADISGVQIGGFQGATQEHSTGVGQKPTITQGIRGVLATIEGAQSGQRIEVNWQFLQKHSGWFFIEPASAGAIKPNYTISGPGSGQLSLLPKNGKSHFVGDSGTSIITLQDTLTPGLYSFKTYLNDGDYGEAFKTFFRVTNSGAIVPA